jgi:hypothetical protein
MFRSTDDLAVSIETKITISRTIYLRFNYIARYAIDTLGGGFGGLSGSPAAIVEEVAEQSCGSLFEKATFD